jgi:hypothetical protein
MWVNGVVGSIMNMFGKGTGNDKDEKIKDNL